MEKSYREGIVEEGGLWKTLNGRFEKCLENVLVFFGKLSYTKFSGRTPTQTSEKLHKNRKKSSKHKREDEHKQKLSKQR